MARRVSVLTALGVSCLVALTGCSSGADPSGPPGAVSAPATLSIPPSDTITPGPPVSSTPPLPSPVAVADLQIAAVDPCALFDTGLRSSLAITRSVAGSNQLGPYCVFDDADGHRSWQVTLNGTQSLEEFVATGDEVENVTVGGATGRVVGSTKQCQVAVALSATSILQVLQDGTYSRADCRAAVTVTGAVLDALRAAQ